MSKIQVTTEQYNAVKSLLENNTPLQVFEMASGDPFLEHDLSDMNLEQIGAIIFDGKNLEVVQPVEIRLSNFYYNERRSEEFKAGFRAACKIAGIDFDNSDDDLPF